MQSVSPKKLLFSSAVLALLNAGCGADTHALGDERDARATASVDEEADHSVNGVVCEVDVPDTLVSFHANANGLVTSVVDHARGFEVVQRAHGVGCDLVDVGTPVAARGLLDVDDNDRLYVFPKSTDEAGLVSTAKNADPFADTVTRVKPSGAIHDLVSAGRGIWSFGVDAAGTALWVTACGPTGVFNIDDDGTVSPGMTPPDSLWQQAPAVLTSASTFWSVGVRTGPYLGELNDASGFALVRADDDGSDDVGATVMDFGNGFEQATLLRCGENVCGLFASALVAWDDAGNVTSTTHTSTFMNDGEMVATASANHLGFYVRLVGGERARLLFVPHPLVDKE